LSSNAQASAETVRSGIKGIYKLLTWIVPIALLIWLLVTYFGNAGKKTPDNPDEFLREYTAVATPFSSGGMTAGLLDYQSWIAYFDSESRDFFDQNAPRIVRRYNSGSTEDIGAMSADALRIEAMKWVIRIPPINGQFRVERVAPRADADFVDADISTASQTFRLVLKKEGGRWRITDMAGVKAKIVQTKEAVP